MAAVTQVMGLLVHWGPGAPQTVPFDIPTGTGRLVLIVIQTTNDWNYGLLEHPDFSEFAPPTMITEDETYSVGALIADTDDDPGSVTFNLNDFHAAGDVFAVRMALEPDEVPTGFRVHEPPYGEIPENTEYSLPGGFTEPGVAVCVVYGRRWGLG